MEACHPAAAVATLAPGGVQRWAPAPATEPAGGTAGRAEAGRSHAELLQVVLLLWAYALYEVLRVGVTGSIAAATAHAHQVTAVERFLGLDIESSIQRAALHSSWFVGACNLGYTLTHLVVPPLVLWLLYRRSPVHYRYWRNAFLVLLGIGLVCFWLYPMSPPRLVPGSGLVDTSHGYVSVRHTPLASLSTPNASSVSGMNPFAAMPSLHVGWAAWAALALWPVLRRRSTRLLAALYPAWMLVAVVVTGNHFVLDCVAAAAATLLACAIVTAGQAIRRDATRRRTRFVGPAELVDSVQPL